jgi:hypothetical protein
VRQWQARLQEGMSDYVHYSIISSIAALEDLGRP